MTEARPRRTEAPEVRRRQILDAAEKRFRESGLHAVKMADVAAEAGVSVGMIYQYFASKEALIEGIVVETTLAQLAQISAIFEGEASTLREAVAAVTKTFEVHIADQERTTLMLEIAAETARNPELRRFVGDVHRKVQPFIREKAARLKPPEWTYEELEARFDVVSGMLTMAVIRYATEARTPTPELLKLMQEAADWLFTPPGG